MSDPKIEGFELEKGFRGMAKDTGSDQTMFKGVHWGKAMMWIKLTRFLLLRQISTLIRERNSRKLGGSLITRRNRQACWTSWKRTHLLKA